MGFGNIIAEIFLSPESFPIWGITGVTAILLGCLITSIPYRGSAAERYNPLNHFISELGYRKYSKFAHIFNISLIAGGILQSVFMLKMGLSLGMPDNIAALCASIAGIFASVSCIFVGIFPMDTIRSHLISATCFFYGGLVSVILWVIVFLREIKPGFPSAYLLLSAFVVIFFALFILIPIVSKTQREALTADMTEFKRPARAWLLTISEWLAMLGISGWIVALSFFFLT
ncbi:MAG: DUF998 domain-containing protein [Clostridiales bacterium]|nr:DUF998 domain-containing protein [Clostridiales bacterium]